jgi:hypothetical protein
MQFDFEQLKQKNLMRRTRKIWDRNPVTKVKGSKKKYDRAKDKFQWRKELP